MNYKKYLNFFLLTVISLSAMDAPDASQNKLSKPTLQYQVPLSEPGAARFTFDGTKLIMGSYACKFFVYDASSDYSKPALTVPVKYNASPIDVDPTNAGNAAIASGFLSVGIWDITSGAQRVTLPSVTSNAWTIEYCKEGKQLLTAVPEQGTFIIDLVSNTSRTVSNAKTNTARYYPQDEHLVACSTGGDITEKGIISIWDLRTNKELHNIQPKRPVYGLEFNPDGSRLVGILPGDFGVWDAKTAALIEYLNLKGDKIDKPVKMPRNKALAYADSLAFIPGTNIFIGAIDSGKITICDLDKRYESAQFNLDDGAVSDAFALDISPDGKTLVTGLYEQNEMRIWDISNIKEKLKEQYKEFTTIALPDGSTEFYNIEGDYVITKTPARVYYAPDGEPINEAYFRRQLDLSAQRMQSASTSRYKCSVV